VRTTLYLLAVSAVLALTVPARGGISAPNSSLQVSRDGTRFLVMLSPDARYDQTSTATLPDGRTINVHDVFSKSGLYNASTLEPVWQVDWFSLQHDLLCSGDLRYVARLNRQGYRSTWAIVFYDGGKETHSYDCRFLLPSMRGEWCLPYSTWDWHTQWYEDFDLDADQKNVLLSTARRRTYLMGHAVDLGRQEFYSFDLAHGTLVTRKTTGSWMIWAYGAAFVSLIVALVFAGKWILRRLKAPDRRRLGH
jgi:hypothetical protein